MTRDRYTLLGKRIELHPATDEWMRGDRYGEVVAVGRHYVHVRLDSGRVRRIAPENIWREVTS